MNLRMGESRRRSRTRAAVFGCIAASALAVDQVSKAWAQQALAHGRSVTVIDGVLSLTLLRNPGASLGLGASMTWLIALLAMVASVVMLVLAWRTSSLRWVAALSLAFAGAVGNLIDRIVYADGVLNGKVVDFLDYGWSVGNVADVFLMVAGIAIVALILCAEPFIQGESVAGEGTESSQVPARCGMDGDARSVAPGADAVGVSDADVCGTEADAHGARGCAIPETVPTSTADDGFARTDGR